ncbi:phage tail tape measure protein, partial [Stenotrophomonas maltophilia]|nr:phage tail tape measure protein [Stenotrophomonas maltophilia]
LDRSQGEPLQQVTSLGDRMKQAGAGIALGAAAMPAMAGGAPVIAPSAAAAAAGGSGASSYTINITAPEGTDGQGIAALVRAEIEKIERDKAGRRSSRLTD